MHAEAKAPGAHTLALPDGTRIAYRVRGQGPPLVLTNGLTTSVRFWDHLLPGWQARHRVLTWDLPGHGDSGPAVTEAWARIERQPDVLAAVMDAAGMERAVQVGWSTGCQVVLEAMRGHAARCEALVLLLGGAGRVLDTAALPLPGALLDGIARHAPAPLFAAGVRLLATVAHAPGGHLVPRWMNLIGPDTEPEDARTITRHLTTIHPRTVQTMIASAQAHSAFDLLPGLRLPVLIVSGDQDRFAPSDAVGAPLSAAIAGSELVRLPRGTHTALLDHAVVIARAVDDFLARKLPAA